MPESLHSLAYFSRNILPAGVDLDTEIADILASARRNNSRADVSGALLFSAGCFAQVLEGPLSAVESIFETIQCDPRHFAVTVLHFRPIETRRFGSWSMAFAGNLAEDAEFAIEGILYDPKGVADTDAGDELVQLLHGLVRRHDANNPVINGDARSASR